MVAGGYSFRTVPEFVGRTLGVTEWLAIDQARISQFADCTDDQQWIHVDVERAERESPVGSTIAHGYLTLSLLARFTYEVGLVRLLVKAQHTIEIEGEEKPAMVAEALAMLVAQ